MADRSAPDSFTAPGHAIIAGFGLPGRAVAEQFDGAGVPYCVVELNADTVQRCARSGTPIIEGDVAEASTLERAGVRNASVLVIAIPDERAAVAATEVAHGLNPSLRIVTRCHYTSRGLEAKSHGATDVVIAEQVVAEEMARLTRELLNTVHLRSPSS